MSTHELHGIHEQGTEDLVAHFNRYIGIDYSGAETAESSCRGLRVFMAKGSDEADTGSASAQSTPKYWTRRGLAEWLREELDRDIPTLVGIDHAFSFPLAYFEKYRLSSDWVDFLEDFHHHWPTDAPHMCVSFIRDGNTGQGLKRAGDRSWLRVTEQWTATAKSVFGFGVQGEVATSTHAGLPWLLYLRKQCKRPVHFWPFDGWEIPEANRSSPRFTRHYGRAVSRGMTAMAMSKRPTRRRHG